MYNTAGVQQMSWWARLTSFAEACTLVYIIAAAAVVLMVRQRARPQQHLT